MWCLPGDNVISYVLHAVGIITFKVEKDSKGNSKVAGMKAVVIEKKNRAREGLESIVDILQKYFKAFFNTSLSMSRICPFWMSLQTKYMQIKPNFISCTLYFPMSLCEKKTVMLKLRIPKA